MVILSDGRVTCSCYDPMGEKEMGNVHQQSVREIWNGKAYQQIRREFLTGRFHLCAGCGQNQVCEVELPDDPSTVLKKLPRKIYIEPSAVCNLRCGATLECGCADFCNPKVILKHRNEKLMSFDTFRRIIDEVHEDLEDLELFNYGETFLNPDAIRMIEYAKKRKESLFVFSSTNGHYFDTDAKRRALIESGIDRLMFSIDGADQATYEKYRHGGRLDQVLNNVHEISRLKREMGRDKPFMEWRYILFNWNDTDEAMSRARDLAREVGVNRLTWHVTSWPKDAPSRRFAPGTAEYERIKPELYTTPGADALDRIETSRGMRSRKYANQLLVVHDMTERNEYASGYPYYAFIDPTNRCTLKCPFCPAGNGSLKQPRGKMAYENFQRAMDLLGPHLFELSLYNWGEPFLHRRIFDMIRCAKQYDIRVQISSNLNHFGPGRAEELVRSGADELIVSIDGITPATYSKYRVGGDFNTVIDNLMRIAEARRRLGSDKPYLIYQFLVFRHNEHEIEQARLFGRKVGADQVKIIPAWCSDPEWIPENERYSRYRKKPARVEVKAPKDASCHWLWNSIVVNWDGSVHPCCSHHDASLSFGNIFEQPFEEVWNGRRYREARRFVKDRSTSCDENICFTCNIIGQRNFNDRYLKDNPILKTFAAPPVRSETPGRIAAKSLERFRAVQSV
jgi:radical SAM protein with 4Fe4S-binding SPASM domain